MRDRTLGIILTLIVVFLFGVPGLACVCLGLTSFLLYPIINSQTAISPAWTNTAGAFGLCVGVFLVLITIVISYFLLHRNVENPPAMVPQPVQPPTTVTPEPPINPDEPLPPTT